MADGLLLIFFLFSYLFVSGVTSRDITIENKCNYTVWPGILTNSTTISLPTTGFRLKRGEARVIDAPSSWLGRFQIWGRSFCSTNSTGGGGGFSCATGDCGSGKIECSRAGTPPATIAEFYIDSSDSGQDFYDVTVVDGYNLPMLVSPQGDKTCNSTGCVVDLNMTCPNELRVTGNNTSLTQPIACMNACQKLKMPEFCCTGDYSTPDKCKPTLYTQQFKSACPRAYSYVFDDTSSTFICASKPNYVITFCPSTILNNTTK